MGFRATNWAYALKQGLKSNQMESNQLEMYFLSKYNLNSQIYKFSLRTFAYIVFHIFDQEDIRLKTKYWA